MKTIRVLEAHPLADLFPMMTAQELHVLAEDIARNGQLAPIVLLDGKILDGRNRYAACAKLGIEPVCSNIQKSVDPVAYVISTNVARRHLNDSQKACIAVKFLPHLATLARHRQLSGLRQGEREGNSHASGRARDLAGQLVGVSGRYVSDACKVMNASPKLFEEVREGRLPLTRAMRLLWRKHQKLTSGVRVTVTDQNTGSSTHFVSGDSFNNVIGRLQELFETERKV